ncbi:hypothetical protein RclHR1_00110003 [Rhizophagus clarus]|uniref:Uncharacterized protein n=1 Tax=Rhizophagus clarus TaxID=94130 RepID=A0A2Z6Q312_9GLOM|nr:hypothetical protein RclHR1_00110003 [Rhizophagus clarus]GES98026.1 hypothetical protein GLOIN_2v1844033 [Rhizophagus clarus]
MPILGTLRKEDGFRGSDELSRQVELPCQNASHLDRQNQYDGSGPTKPPINSEFNDFCGRREDYTNHVWGIGSQWDSNVRDIHQQLENSKRESKIISDTQTVLSECSEKIQALSSQLGPLLRVNTPEGNARAGRKTCHLVLPNDRPKRWRNADDASVCQVLPSDGIDGVHGHRNNSPIVVDTIMKSNRCYIANSLELEIYDEDQEDYISYIKEKLISSIEEVMEHGFDHIIIIGKLHYGLLFLDCFGRVFNLDFMTDALFFCGDYLKGVERITKGLEIKWVPWILDRDKGIIVEIDDGPERYLIPFEKRLMKEKKKKSSSKKRSRKKHH